MTLLSDKAAVVTGAASGNGRGIAMRLAEEGADVVVADIQTEPRLDGTPTHEKVEAETDAQSTFVECDVTDTDDIAAAVDAADEFGGIDVMVNNAGIVLDPKELVDITVEEYRRLMSINMDGVYFGTQIAAEKMIEQGEGGSIVNMSSTAGYRGQSMSAPYSAAKGGVRLFTYAAAADLGPYDIRVNAVHPGVVDTAMTREDWEFIGTELGEATKEEIPLGRFAQPSDVGDVVVFFASDLAGFVTAESLLLDGGQTHTQ
jgi:NAD(P)-dependent dehydrogenase (short-subunit alcohol dehydrogenase family)